jgi:hypothetical protein
MSTGYTVWAYSPTLNQEHRLLDLADTTPYTDQAEAQRDADAFAHTYNRNRKERAEDWIGVVKLETVGITTLPGYIGLK